MPYLTSDPAMLAQIIKMMGNVDKMPSPRVIKTHLPFFLLHPNLLETSKVIISYISKP